MNQPPRNLVKLTERAYHASWPFLFAFEWTLHHHALQPQDTRQTNLYAICSVDGAAWKYGLANKPQERLAMLQIGSFVELVLYAHAPAPAWLEKFFHRALRRHSIRGEWFAAAPRTLALADLLRSCQEITEQVAKTVGAADSGDTVAHLVSRMLEAESVFRREQGIPHGASRRSGN